MKNFYYKLGRKKFLLSAAALLLCGDLFFSFNMVSGFGDFETFQTNLNTFLEQAKNNPQFDELAKMPPNYLKEIYQLARNMMFTFCAIVIIFHLMMYTFLNYNKTFARYYVLILSFSGIIISGLSIPFSSLSYLIPTLSYLYVFMGLVILGRELQSQELQNS